MPFRKHAYYLVVLLLVAVTACAQPVPVKQTGGLWTVDISHDDRYIAIGGDDSLLRIFTKDHQLFQSIKMEQEGMIRCVNWHPAAPLLAISSRNDIWIWDPVSGKKTILEGTHGGSRSVAWNYNGELLAAAAGIGIVWIWNRQGQLLRRIQKTDETGKADKKDFLGIDWHPSKNILVTVGDEIRLFDTAGNQLQSFRHRPQQAGLLTVKWHPSGAFFVTGDYGHPKEGIPVLLQFWKPDGTLIREWNGSKYEYRNIRWNKEGTRLATASDQLRIWTKEGELLYTGRQEQDTTLWGVDWVSDSKKIITVTYSGGNIQLWDEKAKLLKTIQ